jgi:hypothetical protein
LRSWMIRNGRRSGLIDYELQRSNSVCVQRVLTRRQLLR